MSAHKNAKDQSLPSQQEELRDEIIEAIAESISTEMLVNAGYSSSYRATLTLVETEFKDTIDMLISLVTQSKQQARTELLLEIENKVKKELEAAQSNLKYQKDITRNENLIREWEGTVFGIRLIGAIVDKLKEQK